MTIPTECRFDEYTADIRLNRILCGAATRLMRLPGITSSTRQALQRLVGLLAEAGPYTPTDLAGPTVFTRLNQQCRSADRLARMVLGNETLLGSTGGAAGVFLIDMNKVFEQFVTVRLSRYLSGRVTVCPQHRTTLRPRGRLLQILAYATALDLPEGMLIYSQRDGAVPPREIKVGQLKMRLSPWLSD